MVSSQGLESAEWYERELVPSVFAESARQLADRAEIGRGHRALDVGCGTGVVGRECARRVGDGGSVVGLDASADMLAVARRVAPGIAWVRGDAASLPFGAGVFDRVLSQFALMFFGDQVSSVAEMWRVLAPGGRLAVSVAGRLADAEVNARLAELIADEVGETGRYVVEEIYMLGDAEAVDEIFAAAGVGEFSVESEWGTTRASSLEAFVSTEVRSWEPLSELFDDDALATLVRAAETELAFGVADDGHFEFRSPYHIVTAAKGRGAR